MFLLLELAAIGTVVVSGLAHTHQTVSLLIHPKMVSGSRLLPVSTGNILAGITLALFAFEGYQMAIVFAEETKGGSRSIGHAVFGALAIAVIAEVLPVGAALLGIRSLATLTNSSAPLLEVVNQQAGHGLETAVSLGVAVAIFNAVIASMLTVGRVAFSSARDKAWPEPVNRLLGSVHPRTRAPWVATLLLGAGCAAFTALSSLAAVVTFTAVVVLVLYIMVALAAIVSRVRMPQARRPWKMPAWPLPPIVALGFVGLTLWKQTRHDVVISAVIVLAALAYSVLYVRPRRDRRWIPTDVAPAPDDPIPEPEHTGLPA